MSDIVLIDFDGTIVDFAYPKIGKLKHGAKMSLQKIKWMGLKIHIYSSRTSKEVNESQEDRDKHILMMKEFLDENEIPYDEILDIEKPPAFAYIDDRAVAFRNNWKSTIKELKQLGRDQ